MSDFKRKIYGDGNSTDNRNFKNTIYNLNDDNQGFSYSSENGFNSNPYGQSYGQNYSENDFGHNSGNSYNFNYSAGSRGSYARDFDEKREKEKEKKKKRRRTRNIAALVIVGLLLSSGFGYMGAALYDRGADHTTSSNATSSGASSKTSGYTLEKATGSAKTVQQITSEVSDSIVEIKTESISTDTWMSQYVTEGAGSGVIIKKDGYIMTNNHVINGASKVTVTLKDGTEYNAKLVASDATADVAVLKIDAKNLPAVTYGNSNDLSVGDLAVVIGNPLGELGGSVSSGIISARDRTITLDGQPMQLIQTDASVNPGNSGGGLFNEHGQLVGMVVAKSSGSDVEGLGFAIPVNTAAEVAEQLIKNGKVEGRAAIGISIVEVTDEATAFKYGVSELGVYVAEATSSAAKNAGIQSGDRLVAINGTAIKEIADLKGVVSSCKPGDTVKLEIAREGRVMTVKVKLSEENENENKL